MNIEERIRFVVRCVRWAMLNQRGGLPLIEAVAIEGMKWAIDDPENCFDYEDWKTIDEPEVV